jgi:hypothetical protein
MRTLAAERSVHGSGPRPDRPRDPRLAGTLWSLIEFIDEGADDDRTGGEATLVKDQVLAVRRAQLGREFQS